MSERFLDEMRKRGAKIETFFFPGIGDAISFDFKSHHEQFHASSIALGKRAKEGVYVVESDLVIPIDAMCKYCRKDEHCKFIEEFTGCEHVATHLHRNEFHVHFRCKKKRLDEAEETVRRIYELGEIAWRTK